MELKIEIPNDIKFSDLQLSRDPVTKDILFDWSPIEKICEFNNIDIALFRDQHEDNISGFLVAWYADHRRNSGAPDAVAEQLIAEVEVEDQYGDINVISGAPKQ